MSNTATIQPFCFEGNEVRTIIKDEEPWFVAKDVCAILEIKNANDAVAGLDDDEKRGSVVPTPSGNQEMNIISESGLYNLVFKSRKPQAKQFRRWVTHDVLPSIRKTGSYDLPRGKKEVQVNHNHKRISNAPGGLDIRYNLDLTKVITKPTRAGLEILERVTGISFTDINLTVDEAEVSDQVQDFLNQKCVLVDDDKRTSFASIYSAYVAWCKAEKGRFPLSKPPFGKELEAKGGITRAKVGGTLYFFGIALITDERG